MNFNYNNEAIASDEFTAIMQQHFKDGLTVSLTVTGNSMVPFLVHKRDSVILSEYKGDAKKGDILFYVRNNGRCVLHRVKKISSDGIYFIGDGQNVIEGPVSNNSVLAKCNSVHRKGQLKTSKSLVWIFFRHIWLHIIPLRLPIIRLVAKFK